MSGRYHKPWCACVCVYVCESVCSILCLCVYVCVCACMHAYVRVHSCFYMYVHTCTCLCALYPPSSQLHIFHCLIQLTYSQSVVNQSFISVGKRCLHIDQCHYISGIIGSHLTETLSSNLLQPWSHVPF